MNSRNDVPMHKSPPAANNTGELSKNSETKKTLCVHRAGGQYESNRYCEKNRRPRAGCHTEGNQTDHADPGGRPLAENIDTGIRVLLRDAGAHRERVHRVEERKKPPSDWKSDGGFKCGECIN